MPRSRTDIGELLRDAAEGLGRYRLRTSLSVLGVVLGVAAVIAMMSVSEGAAREALAQVEALGIDNLVAKSNTPSLGRSVRKGLAAGDAEAIISLVPLVEASSPLLKQIVRIGRAERSADAAVMGVRPAFQQILRLSARQGRLLAPADEASPTRVCVLGADLARALFAFRDAVGDTVRIGADSCRVVGVLAPQGSGVRTGGSLAWHQLNQAALVPYAVLSGRSVAIAPDQPADEIWLQVSNGARSAEVAPVFEHALERLHGTGTFTVVVPRELLAQRARTARTFSVVIGSVAAIALLVGGIGIMNVMLTSVVERTREIGVRRTAGATRRDVAVQFLVEALLMTGAGGVAGVGLGVLVSVVVAAYAGWATYVSAFAVVVGLFVSVLVGVIFGLYPALKAAALQPVDAMRYE